MLCWGTRTTELCTTFSYRVEHQVRRRKLVEQGAGERECTALQQELSLWVLRRGQGVWGIIRWNEKSNHWRIRLIVRNTSHWDHELMTHAEFWNIDQNTLMWWNDFLIDFWYLQDPDYYKKHGNYHRKVVVACLVWIVCGCIVQYFVIFKLYDRHTDTLNSNNFATDSTTKKNSMLLSAARDRARERGSVEKQSEIFLKKWEEEHTVRLHSKEVED